MGKKALILQVGKMFGGEIGVKSQVTEIQFQIQPTNVLCHGKFVISV